ncbi:MAG: dihydropteroate synthase [Rhodocyclaceae bacterium]|nr:dihydropteroate synthase [Rhodocyclaceae bacterium]
MPIFACGQYRLSLDRPLLMGIVNLTSDSFSGDGCASDTARGIEHARLQLEAGADILDIGAESTRPGALPTPVEEELRRLVPVLREVCTWGVPISVDTYKPDVMRESLMLGAAMINDITGMSDPLALDVVTHSDCGICLMHMQGAPGTMQQAPAYVDVVTEVERFLAQCATACLAAKVKSERIVLDPGFGFGKTLAHNLALFRALTVMNAGDFPWLVGVSRKSMLGGITGRAIGERMPASIAAAMLAAQKGAKILRVHDVAATRDALAVMAALQ